MFSYLLFDINYIKSCVHSVSLIYDTLRMSFRYMSVGPKYVIQSGETDCLSLYRRIKHPMWLHYNQLEYLLQNWYAIFTYNYLMQFFGSFVQSILHLNLSHVSHPKGGVTASPLSNDWTTGINIKTKTSNMFYDLKRIDNIYWVKRT